MEEIQSWFYMTGHINFIIKYQSYGCTWPIAESIRRASAGGMRSTPTSQTLRQQVTMALMRLWPRQSFPMYTPFNRLHFIWRWTHLSYTYVQIISDATAMLFRSAIPSQYVEHLAVVNSTHSTSNFLWLWYVLQ